MNRPFDAALRHATTLTRAGNLAEATRAIQAALTGRPAEGGSGDMPSSSDRPDTASGAPILDLVANAPGSDSPASGRAYAPGPGHTPWNTRRSLADTVRELAGGRHLFEGLPTGAGTSAPPPVSPGARFLSREFTCAAGSRPYRLYVPATAGDAPTGLVVMLHGCKQNADDFATGTTMNAKADAEGVIVVYPGQVSAANPSACWNWFSPADQARGSGEPAILAALARAVAEEFGVASDAVFVAGLSAGGAMAAILAETYPDVFAAAGIHSGLPAGSAVDVASAFGAMGGKIARRAHAKPSTTRLIVFHGTADRTVHPSNGDAIVAARTGNGTAATRSDGRTTGGRRFDRIVHRTADGNADVEHWILDGHGHAWSGGHPSGSYTDPAGPDASAEMVRFFLEPRRTGQD